MAAVDVPAVTKIGLGCGQGYAKLKEQLIAEVDAASPTQCFPGPRC